MNGFEQVCINFANEQLQFYFNQHIFSLEQEEYRSEGIAVETVSFQDNQPCLDLICKKPIGLLHLLDDESNFPKVRCCVCFYVDDLTSVSPPICRLQTYRFWTNATVNTQKTRFTCNPSRGWPNLASNTMLDLSGTRYV